MSGFRRGRRLALDVGSVRVGVASCDPDGILATPLATVRRSDGDDSALTQLLALVREHEPLELVAGRPTSLDGTDRAAADTSAAFLRRLAARTDLPIRLMDERFTTVQAHGMLAASGRSSRQRRERVDAVAAVVILQTAIDAEKRTGEAAGTLLDD